GPKKERSDPPVLVAPWQSSNVCFPPKADISGVSVFDPKQTLAVANPQLAFANKKGRAIPDPFQFILVESMAASACPRLLVSDPRIAGREPVGALDGPILCRHRTAVRKPLVPHCLPRPAINLELVPPSVDILIERFANARTGACWKPTIASSLGENHRVRATLRRLLLILLRREMPLRCEVTAELTPLRSNVPGVIGCSTWSANAAHLTRRSHRRPCTHATARSATGTAAAPLGECASGCRECRAYNCCDDLFTHVQLTS
ncbi:MAG: hypothetical protein ABI853_01390, partial [Sphingomicrobium sp.]